MSESQPSAWTDTNDLAVHFEHQAMERAAKFVGRMVRHHPEVDSMSYDFSAAAINLARYFERRYETEKDPVLLEESEAWMLIADEHIASQRYSELDGLAED